MDLSVIITHRSTDPCRDRNLRTVLSHVAGIAGAEVIVVEQDAHAQLADLPGSASIRHMFVFNPGEFNKSWGFNVGATHAAGRVLMLLDGDILIPHRHLQSSLAICQDGSIPVKPFSCLVDLSAPDSENVCTGLPAEDWSSWRGTDREQDGEHIPFCGGAYLVGAEFYRSIGGHDERFLGWGGEDDAMSVKLLRLAPRAAVLREATAYHLFHPRRSACTPQDLRYAVNKALLAEYAVMNEKELLATRPERLGDPDKYRSELN